MQFLKKYIPHYRTILRLGLPLLLGQLGLIAVSFADNMMVGHYSTAALASASFVNNFLNVAILACIGFAYGLTPILGAMFVRNDSDSIGATLRVGMLVNVIFTLAVMAIMAVFYLNIHWFGQPEELLPLIRPYMLLALAGMIPMCGFNVLSQLSFAVGNTILPTAILLGCNAFNVLGNYLLIFGHWGCPELGLTGAGISTLGARVLTFIVMAAVVSLSGRFRPYHPGYKNARIKWNTVRKVFVTGFPVAMQMTFETAAFSGAAVFAGWLGEIPLAALQIVIICGMFGFCIYYSIAGAMSIDVSHAAGKNDVTGMRRSAWAGYHIILVCMVGACALFYFGGAHLMSWFSNDEAVIALAVTLIFPMILYQFGDATQITFANALRGTSNVMPMLYISFVSYVVAGIPSTYLFAIPLGLGTYGIVLSFSVSLFLAAALYSFYFFRTLRRKNL